MIVSRLFHIKIFSNDICDNLCNLPDINAIDQKGFISLGCSSTPLKYNPKVDRFEK